MRFEWLEKVFKNRAKMQKEKEAIKEAAKWDARMTIDLQNHMHHYIKQIHNQMWQNAFVNSNAMQNEQNTYQVNNGISIGPWNQNYPLPILGQQIQIPPPSTGIVMYPNGNPSILQDFNTQTQQWVTVHQEPPPQPPIYAPPVPREKSDAEKWFDGLGEPQE